MTVRNLFAAMTAFALILAVAKTVPAATTGGGQIIYNDSLQNGWQSWSWAKVDLANTKPVHSGSKSIGVVYSKGWQALYLHHSDFSTTGFSAVSFWIYGAGSGGQQVQFLGLIHGKAAGKSYPIQPLKPGKWQHLVIPLSSIGIASATGVDGFWLQSKTSNPQTGVFVDDISLKE